MEDELILDRGRPGFQLEHASAGFQDRAGGDDTTTRLGAVRVKGDEIHRTR